MPIHPLRSAASVLVVAFLAGCGSESSSSTPEAGDPRELIVNGSFEAPVVDSTKTPYNTYTVATTIEGWTVANVDLVHRMLWKPASGRQSLDLNGPKSGSIACRVATRAGAQYYLSLAYATNPVVDATAPEIRVCRVVWNGVAVETLSVVRTDSIRWDDAHVLLAAQGNDSLRIESISAGRGGVALDDISLVGP